MRNYYFTSDPMKIGHKEWRVVVYDAQGKADVKAFTDYEWRNYGEVIEKASEWRSMTNWPTYDSNDGEFAGCPHTLRKLYEKNQKQINEFIF